MGLEKALPGIGAGMSILGDLANPILQHFQNKSNRRWQEKLNWWQRQDSLADWAMQNEYNSPRAQMQRFQEAGLNPMLIYGRGDEGNAAPVRSSGSSGSAGDAPRVNFSNTQGAFMNIYDMKIKRAQEDNLLTQNTVMKQEKLLKEAQTLESIGRTDANRFDLSQRMRLKDISAEGAALNVEKLKTDIHRANVETGIALDANERAAAMNAKNIEKAVVEIAKIRQERLYVMAQTAKTKDERDKIQADIRSIDQHIENMKKDGTLKDWDIKAREAGILPGQPGWFNVIEKLTKEFRESTIGKSLRSVIPKGGIKGIWKKSGS